MLVGLPTVKSFPDKLFDAIYETIKDSYLELVKGQEVENQENINVKIYIQKLKFFDTNWCLKFFFNKSVDEVNGTIVLNLLDELPVCNN
ncbi:MULTISPECIES: hypothetical protein [Nostocales]|uniref:Uncharacterized protein n=3 Tax=Nostocales TaxID=1161 RepID=A0A0C1R5K3_9CYAN|nr:hypothetical protein [Tolypothrix bouteillei]KAF3888236.1 hypothetical protein DA73_0400024140 [Tolypothrix bouteillei VB521301]